VKPENLLTQILGHHAEHTVDDFDGFTINGHYKKEGTLFCYSFNIFTGTLDVIRPDDSEIIYSMAVRAKLEPITA